MGPMQGDPWTRKKTVMVLAIADIFLAIFLICYAGYRLLYDTNSEEEKGEDAFLHISATKFDILLSILYWIIVFAILSVQLVIAFLLLTATKDMTIDPDTMIKKCFWWRTTSFVFFILLTLEIFHLIYEYYLMTDGRPREPRVLRLVLSCAELLFRLYGVYFIGKFIRDLSTLFAAPIQYAANPSMPSSPIPAPRCPVTSQRGLV